MAVIKARSLIEKLNTTCRRALRDACLGWLKGSTAPVRFAARLPATDDENAPLQAPLSARRHGSLSWVIWWALLAHCESQMSKTGVSLVLASAGMNAVLLTTTSVSISLMPSMMAFLVTEN